MSEYICKKGISLSGTQYVPGEVIPAEAILPSRVLTLKRSGHIVEADFNASGDKGAYSTQNSDSDVHPIKIPISTPDGSFEATVSSQEVYDAFSILQLPEKEAKDAIALVDDDNTLMLIDSAERRKNVLSAIRKRHEELEAKDGEADGEDV